MAAVPAGAAFWHVPRRARRDRQPRLRLRHLRLAAVPASRATGATYLAGSSSTTTPTYDHRGEPIEDDPEATLYGSVTVGVQTWLRHLGRHRGRPVRHREHRPHRPQAADGAVHFEELLASLDEGLLCTFDGERRRAGEESLRTSRSPANGRTKRKLGESGPILSFDLGPGPMLLLALPSRTTSFDAAADVGVAPGIHSGRL